MCLIRKVDNELRMTDFHSAKFTFASEINSVCQTEVLSNASVYLRLKT
jgi:hypothetical protein